jgi:hypothetical protein
LIPQFGSIVDAIRWMSERRDVNQMILSDANTIFIQESLKVLQ